MNVVSLFNGMNTGRQALENVGIKVNKYYSSEIKPYAIQLTQHHFPDTIQVGDVTKWKEWNIDWSTIDLILSGSPCQDLSAAGRIANNRGGINGIKSSLLRDRYYWSNIRTKQDGMFGDIITDIPNPKDKNIFLKDIITSGEVKRKKSNCLTEGLIEKNGRHKIKDFNNWQKYLKKRPQSMVILINENDLVRLPNKVEMCRLQGFPDNYCDILDDRKAGSLLGDGWTLPIIEHIFSFIKP